MYLQLCYQYSLALKLAHAILGIKILVKDDKLHLDEHEEWKVSKDAAQEQDLRQELGQNVDVFSAVR